jgi:hypothetical protein
MASSKLFIKKIDLKDTTEGSIIIFLNQIVSLDTSNQVYALFFLQTELALI